MKISTAIISSLLAISASAFDKYQPWGKRDYACINVYQGIPDNSTVAPGSQIELRFNRAPTTYCPGPLSQYPGGEYNVWLYNNPVRVPNSINFDQSIKIQDGIKEEDGKVTITVPGEIPAVNDDSVWYLRVQTVLETAPQTAFLHRYLKKRFEHSLPVTANVEKHDILLHTTVGPVRYEIWDVSGTQKPNALSSREFDDIDAAIIMFDLTDRISYNNVPNWYQSLVNKDGMRLGRFIPIFICGNKDDASMDARLPPKTITFPKKKGTGYVEMSVMSLSNIHEPFLDLARQLLRNPAVGYKSLPNVGPAAFKSQTDSWVPLWRRENGSQDKDAVVPYILTQEIPPLESPPPMKADISAESFSTVIETPKRADASDGQLKFLNTTNKVQNELKPPVNGTVPVFKETKPAVNGTVPVAEVEGTNLHIVATEERGATKKHQEPTKEHRESKKAHQSPEEKPNTVKDQGLFVLCIHCIRMVLIKSIQETPLAHLSNDKPSFALITTACRSCCRDSKKSQSDEVRMSPDLIRYTAMYECARKVAEEEVEVLADKSSVAHISLDKLTNSIGRECQIQGISTSPEILQRLRQVARKDVLLGYVPGAFL
ncbi:putative RAN small monomeric GTPase (Ran) [Aspergillus thermomutatus]|uniref:Uncharacterized protein n=1 Tax=Aspergillus thermomutatus TaxID=41047 RepID=A0A397HFA5_ASPTH|nr:uncharacterized protein CDV56_108934 [Aspergillus thermomutatus]RHZ61831.1 hypothetical protein CDV56_108934 [Aspergillus thermomutatus]